MITGTMSRLRITIFGLSISSTWGNGHAALWRGLVTALIHDGHEIRFFERDTPYYAAHRDLHALPEGGLLTLYSAWADVIDDARRAVMQSDVVIITSYCMDGVNAALLAQENARCLKCFYDLDTPVTLQRLEAGQAVEYLPGDGLRDFDLVLSYTGGRAIETMQSVLGAKRVVPIYGCVDPDVHRPADPKPQYAATLSYIGTYAPDRQATLSRMLIETARQLSDKRFVIAGAQYPQEFPWEPNIYFVRHLPPPEHPSFYASSAATLNVTRGAMAAMGWCPSGRLFEAASCGVPVISDCWEGIADFFAPGKEILLADTTEDVRRALSMPAEELRAIGARARMRALDEHTAAHRAREMIHAFEHADTLCSPES